MKGSLLPFNKGEASNTDDKQLRWKTIISFLQFEMPRNTVPVDNQTCHVLQVGKQYMYCLQRLKVLKSTVGAHLLINSTTITPAKHHTCHSKVLGGGVWQKCNNHSHSHISPYTIDKKKQVLPKTFGQNIIV